MFKKDDKTSVNLFLSAYGQSNRFFNSGEFPGEPEIVRMTETAGKTGLGFRFTPSKDLMLSLEFGLLFLRQLSFMDEDVFYSSDIRSFAFGGVKFRWTFGKSITQNWLNI